MKEESGSETNPGPVKVRWLNKNELEIFLEEELSLKNVSEVVNNIK